MKRLSMTPARLLMAALCLTLTAAGCPSEPGKGTTMNPNDKNTNNAPAAHEHAHGPHGGHIIEADPLHIELAMDAQKNLTAYLLGEDAKTAAPTENVKLVLHLASGTEKKEIALTASPLEGETAEKCSRFVAEGKNFPEAVKDIEEVKGELAFTTATGTKTLKIEEDHDHGHAHAEPEKK